MPLPQEQTPSDPYSLLTGSAPNSLRLRLLNLMATAVTLEELTEVPEERSRMYSLDEDPEKDDQEKLLAFMDRAEKVSGRDQLAKQYRKMRGEYRKQISMKKSALVALVSKTVPQESERFFTNN